MHRRKSIQINLDHPCTQNWDEMTPVSGGRHCVHCRKTVVDFTSYTDAALYQFFAKNTGDVCGRAFDTQLDRAINIPYQPHSRLYRMAVAMGLTLLFTQVPKAEAKCRPPYASVKYEAMPSEVFMEPGPDSTGIMGKVIFNYYETGDFSNTVVILYQDTVEKGRVKPDRNGNYFFGPLEAGQYQVMALIDPAENLKTDTHIVVVSQGKIARADLFLESRHIKMGVMELPKFSPGFKY